MLCHGNLIKSDNYAFFLRCSGTADLQPHYEMTVNRYRTLDEVQPGGNQGILSMRGFGWDDYEFNSISNSSKYILNACVQPDWQKVVAQDSTGVVLNYYEESCELHGQVRVKTVYRVIV